MNNFAVRNILLPLLIGIAASCWLLPSLGNGMLWQDEAQTALLARTTLRYGVPVAFDGPNSISQERGDDYGPHNLWKWHMWLPFYVLAGFFKIFGESTAIARLPFALFGMATVVLSYFTSLLTWRDVKTAVVSALLILACVPFALLVRQCRYYSPCMFFSLLMLDAYLRICGGWRRGWIVLAIAATLLFNSHFIYTGTAFAAIGLHAAIWHRNQWKPLLFAAITTGVLCAPPVLWLASLNYRNYAGGVMNRHFLRMQVHTYAKLIVTEVLPYPLLLIPIAAGVKAVMKRRPILPTMTALEPWALPIFFTLITLVAISPFTPWPFFRYLGPAIAPLMILVARWIVVAFRTNLIFGALVVALLALWWPVAQYMDELRHPFVGPMEGIVQLLQSEGKPGDKVVISYGDLPIKFYTKYRVFGGLAGDDLTAARGARWLFLRHHLVSDHTMPVREFILDQLKQNPNYQMRTLDVPDTEFENREEPEDHLFRSATGIPKVVVYQLRQP